MALPAAWHSGKLGAGVVSSSNKSIYPEGVMASKRHIRRKQCSGKVKYGSMDAANIVVDNWHKHGDTFIHAYECKFCGQYHIGHMPKEMRKKAIARMTMGRDKYNK